MLHYVVILLRQFYSINVYRIGIGCIIPFHGYSLPEMFCKRYIIGIGPANGNGCLFCSIGMFSYECTCRNSTESSFREKRIQFF